MLQFKTQNYAGSSVQYSPFLDNRLAVGASANFGLVGNGKLFILDLTPQGTVHEARSLDTQDAITSTAWSEINQNQIAVGGGDGIVRLFDLSTRQALPILRYAEHQREVFGVDWNLVNKTQFASASWDGSIKVWDYQRPNSLTTMMSPPTIPEKQAVYNAKWAPHNDFSILSSHGDSHARVWDARTGAQALTIKAVLNGDCLCVDWNKYDPNLVATGGVDTAIKVWDLRNLQAPINDFRGHQYAVKAIKWSPHSGNLIMSASYDMSVKVWDNAPGGRVPFVGMKGLVKDFTLHTEFAVDCDWSLWGEPGWVASVGWDQMLYIWKAV